MRCLCPTTGPRKDRSPNPPMIHLLKRRKTSSPLSASGVALQERFVSLLRAHIVAARLALLCMSPACWRRVGASGSKQVELLAHLVMFTSQSIERSEQLVDKMRSLNREIKFLNRTVSNLNQRLTVLEKAKEEEEEEEEVEGNMNM